MSVVLAPLPGDTLAAMAPLLHRMCAMTCLLSPGVLTQVRDTWWACNDAHHVTDLEDNSRGRRWARQATLDQVLAWTERTSLSRVGFPDEYTAWPVGDRVLQAILHHQEVPGRCTARVTTKELREDQWRQVFARTWDATTSAYNDLHLSSSAPDPGVAVTGRTAWWIAGTLMSQGRAHQIQGEAGTFWRAAGMALAELGREGLDLTARALAGTNDRPALLLGLADPIGPRGGRWTWRAMRRDSVDGLQQVIDGRAFGAT